MNAEPTTPKRTRGQRVWTDEQRAAQGRKIRERQIWLKSTGPRTSMGKRISARNSYKHGRFTYEKQVLRWYVRLAALRLKQLHAAASAAIRERENELIDKYDLPNPPKPDIMAFYPYFKVSPFSPEFRKLLKPQKPQKTKDPYDVHKVFDYLTSLSEAGAENGLHNSD